jgi:hypothetical protein
VGVAKGKYTCAAVLDVGPFGSTLKNETEVVVPE